MLQLLTFNLQCISEAVADLELNLVVHIAQCQISKFTCDFPIGDYLI